MRIHVRPLRPGVPADNGARVMLPETGAVREPGAYWDRMVRIGAVEVRPLPERGQVVMIRPVGEAKVLTTGHRAEKAPVTKNRGDGVLWEDGAEVEWSEAHEGALADNLIQFPVHAEDEMSDAAPGRDAQDVEDPNV